MTIQEKQEIKRLVRAYTDPGVFFTWVDELTDPSSKIYPLHAWREAERVLLDTLGVNKYSSWDSYRIARINWDKKKVI